MYKELVEIRVRIFSENVTLRVFLSLACAPLPCPAAPGLVLAKLHAGTVLPPRKKPAAHDAAGFYELRKKLFFLRFDGFARNLVFSFGLVFFLVPLGFGVGVLGGGYGSGHDGEMRLVNGCPLYGKGQRPAVFQANRARLARGQAACIPMLPPRCGECPASSCAPPVFWG